MKKLCGMQDVDTPKVLAALVSPTYGDFEGAMRLTTGSLFSQQRTASLRKYS